MEALKEETLESDYKISDVENKLNRAVQSRRFKLQPKTERFPT